MSNREEKRNERMSKYKRGTVWWIDLPLRPNTHIQGGARPCLIVSNMIDRCGVVTVCPMSTKLDGIATHTKVMTKKESQVLIEQITTIDVNKIGEFVCRLSSEDIQSVDKVLSSYLLSSNVDDVESPATVSVDMSKIMDKLDIMSEKLDFLCWRENK